MGKVNFGSFQDISAYFELIFILIITKNKSLLNLVQVLEWEWSMITDYIYFMVTIQLRVTSEFEI